LIRLAKDEVLRGLKRCKRRAKQDLRASALTGDPDYWNKQAQARRAVYSELIEQVEENGVEQAYELAIQRYAALPFSVPNSMEMPNSMETPNGMETDPVVAGNRQALGIFLSMLGMNDDTGTTAQAEADLVEAHV